MIVDTIRKNHPKGITNGSLGMLISTINLVKVYVIAKTRDLLTST
jgi:hydroxymethylglutaryl-CoA reductase